MIKVISGRDFVTLSGKMDKRSPEKIIGKALTNNGWIYYTSHERVLSSQAAHEFMVESIYCKTHAL